VNDEGRERIHLDFEAVYVPTDVTWSDQVSALSDGWDDPRAIAMVSMSAFAGHAYLAFVTQLESLLAEADRPYERELTHALADNFLVSPELSGVANLKKALRARVGQVGRIASKERVLGASGRADRLAGYEFLHLPVPSTLAGAIEIVDEYCESLNGHPWALAVDELEIAPTAIARTVFSWLRSTEQRLILKLAMAPYAGESEIAISGLDSKEGEDFNVVNLTFGHKEDGYTFGRAMVEKYLERRSVTLQPEGWLGTSVFEATSSEYKHERGSTSYVPSGRRVQTMRRLSKKDAAFADFLGDRELDLEAAIFEADQRAADVRKHLAAIILRDRYFDDSGGRKTLKNAAVYSGMPALLAMTEGNPRLLTSYLSRVYEEWNRRTPTGRKRVPPDMQSREIKRLTARFRSFIQTFPVGEGHEGMNILQFTDSVGKEMRRRYYDPGVFPADPVTSFLVDSTASASLLELVGRGLNCGALVFVPSGAVASPLGSLRGKRIRLNYLLAAHHQLPISLGRAVSLTYLLDARAVDDQGELFELDEVEDD
jgi:hypothetical protein